MKTMIPRTPPTNGMQTHRNQGIAFVEKKRCQSNDGSKHELQVCVGQPISEVGASVVTRFRLHFTRTRKEARMKKRKGNRERTGTGATLSIPPRARFRTYFQEPAGISRLPSATCARDTEKKPFFL